MTMTTALLQFTNGSSTRAYELALAMSAVALPIYQDMWSRTKADLDRMMHEENIADGLYTEGEE